MDTPLLGAQGFPCWICLVVPLPQALADQDRFQPTSNLEWKKLGRNSGGSHLYVSMPLGAEQRGEEGERKEGVEFRGWRGGYRGVCLLEGPE